MEFYFHFQTAVPSGGQPTRNQEQKAALETASYVMNRAVGGASRVATSGGSGQSGSSEPRAEQDKKLKNLRKVGGTNIQ